MNDDSQILVKLAEMQASLVKLVERDARLETLIEAGTNERQRQHDDLLTKVEANAGATRTLASEVEKLKERVSLAEKATKVVSDKADSATSKAGESVDEVRGIGDGLKSHLSKFERTGEAREVTAKAERDAAEAKRATATAEHAARFEAQSDALKRQATGIVTVGAAVGNLETWVKRAFCVVGLVLVAGIALTVCTVVASRTDVVRIGVVK